MSLRLNGSTSGYSEIDAPAVGGNNTITLPGANPTANGSFLLGATSGQLSFSTDPTLTSLNGGPLAGFRNRIINGNFDIWQRGTSFSPAINTYTADRWVIVYDGSGATRTILQRPFIPGSTEAAPGAALFLEFNQSVAGSGGTFNVLQQRIEDVRTFGGQTVTLSFYARGVSAALTLPGINISQNFGTGGSATVFNNLASSIVIAATNFARYTYTVTLPSIIGKTIGTGSHLSLEILLPNNATFNFQIASIQLEPGPVATPFEQRPIGTELALCQRYYETGRVSAFATATNTHHLGAPCFYKVTKRAVPTVALVSVASIQFPGTVGSIQATTTTGFNEVRVADNSGANGQFQSDFTASAEL